MVKYDLIFRMCLPQVEMDTLTIEKFARVRCDPNFAGNDEQPPRGSFVFPPDLYPLALEFILAPVEAELSESPGADEAISPTTPCFGISLST